MQKAHYHLIRALIYFILLIVIGTIGYLSLLRIDFLQAILMTFITIFTAGYQQAAGMDTPARLFSILLVFGGIGLVGYTLTNLAEYLTGSSIKYAWRLRKMESRIENLKDHYIVCGAGETGQSVAAHFEMSMVPFVVIDNREDKVKELRERGYLAIHGEATQESTLKEAGISKAKGLVTALSTDSENIYVVLTARYLNRDLYIVARAIEPHANEKLTMAGADKTVSPNVIGGRRMAAMMTKPTIFSFLDIVTYAGNDVYNLEEVTIQSGSELDGIEIKQARVRERAGLIIMSLKKNNGKMIFNPGAEEKLEAGDSMIVVGNEENVKQLSLIAGNITGEKAAAI